MAALDSNHFSDFNASNTGWMIEVADIYIYILKNKEIHAANMSYTSVILRIQLRPLFPSTERVTSIHLGMWALMQHGQTDAESKTKCYL